MEDLVVQLDNYSRLGIPKLHHLPSFVDSAEDRVEEGKVYNVDLAEDRVEEGILYIPILRLSQLNLV